MGQERLLSIVWYVSTGKLRAETPASLHLNLDSDLLPCSQMWAKSYSGSPLSRLRSRFTTKQGTYAVPSVSKVIERPGDKLPALVLLHSEEHHHAVLQEAGLKTPVSLTIRCHISCSGS